MKRRWMLYITAGATFGIFDFYYHAVLSNILLPHQDSLAGRLAWGILSTGVWLIPVIPVVLHETKASRSAWLSALAAAVTWTAAVIFYYLNNAVQLAFIGVASRPEMHISNRADPHFWDNWRNVLIYTLLVDNIIWLVVAVVGGFAVGYALSVLYLRSAAGKSQASRT